MNAARRRLLWLGVGISLTALAITAIVALVAGDFGDDFWRTIGTIVTLFVAGSAALAGIELLHRGQLRPLGLFVLATAPVEAGTLLFAIWKESISVTYGKGVLMTALILLAGLVVSTLRLIVDLEVTAVAVLYTFVAACTLALVALATPLIWIDDAPDAALRAMLALIVVVLIGYALTPVVQRLVHRH
jgi:hypothetical protein